MRINRIMQSEVDGPGMQTVLFMQGCSIRCPGYQNQVRQNEHGRQVVSIEDLDGELNHLAAQTSGRLIRGGESTDQPGELKRLLERLRSEHEITYIILCVGRSSEWILRNAREILPLLDVVVDGPFIQAQDHNLPAYRGSQNQCPINVQASLKCNQVVTPDWDNEVVIREDGSLLLTAMPQNHFSGTA